MHELKLKCSKATGGHILGSAYVEDGQVIRLRYKDATRVDVTGNDRRDFATVERDFGSKGGSRLFCQACGMVYQMPRLSQLVELAESGQKALRLQGGNPLARVSNTSRPQVP